LPLSDEKFSTLIRRDSGLFQLFDAKGQVKRTIFTIY
jgi:hypothetical protein